jgi:phage terminase large subunit
MKLILPKPTPKQEEFLRARTRYVAYGGCRGGGKSYAVDIKAPVLALAHAGIKILILRRTYAELKQNHIDKLCAMLIGVARYKDSDKVLIFPNGSRIFFGYCDSEGDARRYQGQEYDVIFIDEATQLPWEWVEKLNTSIRGVNDFPKRMYFTCNPGGVGHQWIKRLFIDREYLPGENPEDYTFIRSGVLDNAPLMAKDPGYIKTLEALSPDLRRAWLDGDWDGLAGAFFPEFRRDIHVCAPFSIPSWWRLYRAFDYGLDALSCVWAAMDDHGELWVYRHLECGNLVISDAAKTIFDAQMPGEEERIVDTYIPPDMRSRSRDSGRSQDELFRDAGIYGVFASNNREAGWVSVKEWMRIMRGADGCDASRLHIFDTCNLLIKNITLLQHDMRNPNDAATEPHDITHSCDALRYLLVSHQRNAPAPPMSEEDKERKRLEEFKARAIRGKNGVRRTRFS